MIKNKFFSILSLLFLLAMTTSCVQHQSSNQQDRFHLVVLAPAHFHAALVQKSMYPQIDSNVKVFAPPSGEQGIETYLGYINEYNHRDENPTHWKEEVYTDTDYLQKMLQEEKTGRNAIVVIAGNNKKKTEYISRSIAAGMNVLSDKPMAITAEGFQQLKAAFDSAKNKKVLLYDIMTMRYGMTGILQKMLMHMPDVFGTLKEGTLDDPSIVFKSVHHFYKKVSGKTLTRPVWYFDTEQQGEGIVDVTTHLVDLIQWECFPQTVFDYKKDVKMLSARHWPTILSLQEYAQVTGVDSFPAFLKDDIKENKLHVFANGEMNYTLKGIHTQVSVQWKYVAPEGAGDTYFAMLKGTKATLTVRQDSAQGYKPVLYIKPADKANQQWEKDLQKGLENIAQTYPGVDVIKTDLGWKVNIPENLKVSHEDQFASVVKKYLQYLEAGKMPEWEISAMLTKYYTTTRALEVADKQ